MDESVEKLYSALNQGPVFLFLGQNYLQLESGNDPFLTEIIRKYGKPTENAQSYYDIFESEAQNFGHDALAWMHRLCGRLSSPKWLETISEFAWNGVYTSAIDIIWPKVFRRNWRELQPIFEERYSYSDPRNRSKLHCTFLFGRVDREDILEKAPLSKRDWFKRSQVAAAFARRLPEIITPLGLLLIEGYDSELDWFSLENLLSTIVDELNPGQTHIFNATENLENDSYANLLIKDGKLILHKDSLAGFLLQGHELGLLQLGQEPQERKYDKKIQLADLSLAVPTTLWNQVSRSATILDDAILLPAKPLSPDARYREFRNFLAESGSKPVWSGYARGFAFIRDFEKKLKSKVKTKLRSKQLQDEPILLHGQTGTGKTVALGHLAYKIREERNFPVLFIEGKTKKPIHSDIDAFCHWIKDEWEATGRSTVPTTLIVWDANEVDSYYSLLHYLVGRGHKVLLVGSSYRLRSSTTKTKVIDIEAPAGLKDSRSESEIVRFTKFLDDFEPSLGRQLHRHISKYDRTFLVALYRLLPATRSLIRSGVIKEYDRTERNLVQFAHTEKFSDEPELLHSTLYYALLKAGIIKEDEQISSKKVKIAGDEITEIQKLLGLIMVPGSLGLQVPFELLLRSLRKEEIRIYTDLLSRFDIFRWHEDAAGNITIGSRHPLEAKLWVRANMGGPKFEIDYAKELLFGIKDTGDLYSNPEVQFAVDLVRNIGPNNIASTKRFYPYLKDIAETLGELREQRSIQNPRLVLQEATLLREYVRQQSQEGYPPKDAEQMLDKAGDILNDAVELLGDDPKNKSIFFGELSAILGTKFLHLLKLADSTERAVDHFKQSCDAALRSWGLDTQNFIPVDILSWTTRDLLKMDTGTLPSQHRFEAEANILHIFEMAEAEEFGAVQEEKFQQRRYQIGRVLGREDLTDDAFERLGSLGSSAGYYLKAHYMVPHLPSDRPLNPRERKACTKAVEYLKKNFDAISGDERSLYLLFKLWWMSRTTKTMFYGERQSVPFSYEDWHYCFQLIGKLMSIAEAYSSGKMLYLYGLSAFHLGETKHSFEIFKQLERDSDYMTGRRRILRSYLASLPNGEPRKFTGEVNWVADDGSKGGVFTPELREVIPFFPRDFTRPHIRRGDSINEFHVAFNFIGPIADPVSFRKKMSR